MNKNYNELLKKEISNLNYVPNLLLHSCCGPCSSHVISYLTKYFNITIFYYNPNIFPEEEYNKRKKEQIRLLNSIEHKSTLNIIDCDYDNNNYELLVQGLENEPEGGKRCYNCINMRLEKTCIIAKRYNYDYYCTTLSVSPHKNSNTINEIGYILESKYKQKWLPSDFKKEEGYKRSIELSKKYNLYRQNYCGCKYSIYN